VTDIIIDLRKNFWRRDAACTDGDGGRKSPNLPAQFAHVVCDSQRLPNNRDVA
jgi:hypothetical protein